MKNVYNFQKVKVRSQGIAWHFLDFVQFHPGVAYKCVAYKKNMYCLILMSLQDIAICPIVFYLFLKFSDTGAHVVEGPRGSDPCTFSIQSKLCPQVLKPI